ncbi:MAG: CHASE2 domain-containing protein [Candidatus Omnitrophica bacterium]|nr:CHASE2 domain-containing protein [Candidatus Omnitrophota bacterium]
MASLRRVYLATGGVALLLTAFLFLAGASIPFLGSVDVKGRDLFFRLRQTISPPPPEANDLLLINLDDETLRRLELRWPYPRSIYAEALARLKPYSPKAIGFDLIFSGEDFSVESDLAFSDALQTAGNVVIASHQGLGGEIGPSPLIRQSASFVGVVDKPRDRDRIIRRALLAFPMGRELYPSWELALFKKVFSESGAEQFPIHRDLVINYSLRFEEFPQIPFWRLLEGSVLDKEVRNKIVLFGLTAEVFHDIHATPLGSMPGVAVNANVLLMLMSNHFFSFISRWITALLTFLVFWLTLLVVLSSSTAVAFFTVCSVAFLYLIGGYLLFTNQIILDLWLTVVGMVLVLMGGLIFRQGQLFFENLKLREESARDPLTDFYNRRFLILKLKSEFNHLISVGSLFAKDSEVSIIMLDLDNFKLVNDSFGHPEGDRVLCTLAETIRSSVRKGELICRYGGDEFCVILPTTSIQNAAKFAEKLCKLIADHPPLSYRTAANVDSIRVTASFGIASSSLVKTTDSQKLLKAADLAMYRAKAQGGNQVVVFDPTCDMMT